MIRTISRIKSANLNYGIAVAFALLLLGKHGHALSQTTSRVTGLKPPIRITESLEFTQPRWSTSSADTIAFVGSDGTYIGALSSGVVRKVSDERAGFHYIWSDDGDNLLYRGSASDTSMAIYSIRLSTGHGSVLTVGSSLSLPQKTAFGIVLYHDGIQSNALGDRSKNARADSAVLAYQSEDNIFIVQNGVTTKITHDDGKYFLPQISPDGSLLLYQEISRGYFVYELAKGTTSYLSCGDDATWSPDSRYIAFERVKDNGDVITASDLFICDLTGNVVQLTDTPSLIEMEPAWSPNGGMLAYVADGAVYVAEIIRGGGRR